MPGTARGATGGDGLIWPEVLRELTIELGSAAEARWLIEEVYERHGDAPVAHREFEFDVMYVTTATNKARLDVVGQDSAAVQLSEALHFSDGRNGNLEPGNLCGQLRTLTSRGI